MSYFCAQNESRHYVLKVFKNRIDAKLASVNYSVTYISKSGNPIFLENIEGAQKLHIERLITQYVSTSFALPGRDIEELEDFYLIRYKSES